MKALLPRFRAALLAGLLAGCGSSSSSGSNDASVSGTYASQCAAACTLPSSGPCATEDAHNCQLYCTTNTDRFEATCAECLIAHSGWTGMECSSGANPCQCYFGPGGTNCLPGPNCACSKADEMCSGFYLAQTTDKACASVCGTAADGGSSSSGDGG